MPEAFFAKLADRGTIAVTGPDAVKFLNGLVTNELGRLSAGQAAHAGLLSPQGKILFDFLVLRTPDGFLLDVAADKTADCLKRLSLYRLRAHVSMSDETSGYVVVALWEDYELPQTGLFYRDPRHEDLGARGFAARAGTAPSGMQELPAADYHAHRIALGVPEGGKDYLFGDAYPHEADFDLFHGVSFRKGCYVGQEVVSRMQHKTVVRKRVVRVHGAEELTPGCDVMDGDVNIGRLGSTHGHDGLALLRLDRAVSATASQTGMTACGVAISLHKDDLLRYRKAAGAAET